MNARHLHFHTIRSPDHVLILAASVEDQYKLNNATLSDFSRRFVSRGGLPFRGFYRHVLFARGQSVR